MTVMLQIMLGVGLGLLGAIFITYKAIQYNPQENNKTKTNFFAAPGGRCAICLDDMNDERNMQYLVCGHALHDKCFRQVKSLTKQCPECRAKI